MSNTYQTVDYVIAIASQLLAFLAIVSNVFVLYVIYKKPKLRTNTFIFLANQAVSDGMYGLWQHLQLLTCNHSWAKSSRTVLFGCEISVTMALGSIVLSMNFILVIAFERYYKLYYPHAKKYNPVAVSATVWLFSLFTTFLHMPNEQLTTYFGEKNFFGCITMFQEIGDYSFFSHRYKFYVSTVIVVYVPVVLSTFLYTKVILKVRQSSVLKVKLNRTQSKSSQQAIAKKSATIKMLIAMMVVFYLMSLPILINCLVSLFNARTRTCHAEMMTSPAIRIWLMATLLAALTNPIILCYFNKTFKLELISLMRKVFCIKVRNECVPQQMEARSRLPTTTSF